MSTKNKVLSFACAVACFSAFLQARSVYADDAPIAGLSKAPAFSAEAWRQAATGASPNWSRQLLFDRFAEEYGITGMKRDRIIALLGEPDVATELQPGGTDRSRIDAYCLSAKDDSSLRIYYSAGDNAVRYAVEETPCKLCTSPIDPAAAGGKVLTREKLTSSVLRRYRESDLRNMTIVQLEGVIGSADKAWFVKAPTGGQVWMNLRYAWRLTPDGRSLFIVDQLSPPGDWQSGTDPGIRSYSIISNAFDCSTRSTSGRHAPAR